MPRLRDREATPYHPKLDGIAERYTGFVKQVIRCLMLERDYKKDLCLPYYQKSPFIATVCTTRPVKNTPTHIGVWSSPR